MDITIDFNIFNVRKCTIPEYVTNLQTATSSNNARAITGSNTLRSRGRINLSHKIILEGNNLHKKNWMIQMINTVQKKMMRMSIQMMNNK